MLAIANELQTAGADVRMAGGGAGTQFVALHGYDEFEPTIVDYIDTYQGGSLWTVLTESVPATASRVTEYVEWLRDLDPDALVTDDMFAAIAATRVDLPLYVLKHDVPALYQNRIERAGASFHTSFQLSVAREFFYPTVWPQSNADPAGVTYVPPIALDGDGRKRPAPEVVVVPSHYSELGRIADQLTRQGYDVLDVGSDEWEPVASLLPYLRDADVVVCSGYSTVMDAAVAGTPCIIHPATAEQDAVAGWLERFDVEGFTIAPKPLDVLEAVESPPEPPAFENGAAVIAETVMNDLSRGASVGIRNYDPVSMHAGRTATVRDQQFTADGGGVRAVRIRGNRLGRSRQWIADRLVAGTTALGAALQAVALHSRALAVVTKRHASNVAATVRRHAIRAQRAARKHFSAAVVTLGRIARTAAHRFRRYRTATVAMAVAMAIVARAGLWRIVSGFTSRLRTATETVRESTTSGLDHAVNGLHAVADVVTSTVDRLRGLGEYLKRDRRILD